MQKEAEVFTHATNQLRTLFGYLKTLRLESGTLTRVKPGCPNLQQISHRNRLIFRGVQHWNKTINIGYKLRYLKLERASENPERDQGADKVARLAGPSKE